MKLIRQVLWIAAVSWCACEVGLAQPVSTMSVGAATVMLQPKGSDQSPPAAPFRTEALLKQAAPSSQWYSTLVFNAAPGPIFAQPLSFKCTPAGLEMALPRHQAAAQLTVTPAGEPLPWNPNVVDCPAPSVPL